MKEKKVVVVTGHSQGIGRATCELLKKEEYTTIGLSRSHYDRNVVESYEVDVSNSERLAEVFTDIGKKYKKIDILINNAGIFPLTKFSETCEYTYDEIIGTNMNGVYWGCRAALPFIPTGGSIINIASISGMKAEADAIEYSMTKAAVISLTKSLAKYLNGRIRVNCVSPGFVRTNLVPGEIPKELIDTIPLKREGQPGEIARVVLFLINNEYINGSNIVIDGGVLL